MLGVAGGERLLAMGSSLDEIAMEIAYQCEVTTGDADFRDPPSFFGLPQKRRRQFARRPQFAAHKRRDPLTVSSNKALQKVVALNGEVRCAIEGRLCFFG